MSISGWCALAVFVTLGCAFEYMWMAGFAKLDKPLTRNQRLGVGTALLSIAIIALLYALSQYYGREL